jgi:hypothetical protein
VQFGRRDIIEYLVDRTIAENHVDRVEWIAIHQDDDRAYTVFHAASPMRTRTMRITIDQIRSRGVKLIREGPIGDTRRL